LRLANVTLPPTASISIGNELKLNGEEESISLVTVAEIRSLSIQFRWGAIRRAKMEELLFRLAILDINAPEIIDRYVEIDCYSKGKHLTRSSNFSAIKMGKNDLWIAATASVYECKLLTMDLDFGHLRDEFIDVVYITPSTFMS
jgi:tRNA(fMet)-specific endonuclease VapC